MNRILRKFLVGLALPILVAGCEVLDQGFDLSTDIDPCIDARANCVEPTGANLLALSISNSNPALVKSSDNCAGTGSICIFDISGLCNEADYPENIIEYRVYDVNSLVDLIPVTRIVNICKRGRFKFQVGLAAGDVSTAKRLSVEIIGRNLTGTEDRNTLAARKEVDLLLLTVF